MEELVEPKVEEEGPGHSERCVEPTRKGNTTGYKEENALKTRLRVVYKGH